MKLKFTDEIFCFLEFASCESIIAGILLDSKKENIKDEGNFLSKGEGDLLVYLPVSKYNKVENPWEECRTPIKIGRFIRKVLTDFAILNFGIDDSKIERFVNLYKSYFTRDPSKLKIVEGEELRMYYLESNYWAPHGYKYGTLWNSCMRQKERNKFLSLYEKNPDSVKMLAYIEDSKVRARALLWQEVHEHGSEKTYKVMDRIYYVYDHDVDFFKYWAKENGYISKWYQNAKSEAIFDDDGVSNLELYVNLPVHNLSYAPYLDTFKFYNLHKGRFSNSPNWNYDYVLVQSNGEYERPPETEELYDDTNNEEEGGF